jgi:hypothetical protein
MAYPFIEWKAATFSKLPRIKQRNDRVELATRKPEREFFDSGRKQDP